MIRSDRPSVMGAMAPLILSHYTAASALGTEGRLVRLDYREDQQLLIRITPCPSSPKPISVN